MIGLAAFVDEYVLPQPGFASDHRLSHHDIAMLFERLDAAGVQDQHSPASLGLGVGFDHTVARCRSRQSNRQRRGRTTQLKVAPLQPGQLSPT